MAAQRPLQPGRLAARLRSSHTGHTRHDCMRVSPTEPADYPQVSILLPVWNAAETLGACLSSITRQTLTSWECVIVDDGSTDGSAAMAAETARRDGRFRLRSIPHAGLIAALNEGLRHCR